MKNYGFTRVAAAVPAVKVANTRYNTEEICRLTSEAFDRKVSLVVFPELSVTGSTCGSLFAQSTLTTQAEEGIRRIIEHSRGKATAIVVGTPIRHQGRIYNCAVVIRNGNIKGIIPKIHLQSGSIFASGSDFLDGTAANGAFLDNGKDTVRDCFGSEIIYAGQRCNISPNLIFDFRGFSFAVEIGEDSYSPASTAAFCVLSGATVIAHPAAENETALKNRRRSMMLCGASTGKISAYITASAGYGESTQDMVYAGAASIYENGDLLAENGLFQTEPSLLVADIDIEKLETARQKDVSFKAYCPDGRSWTSFRNMFCRIPLGVTSDTDFEEELMRHVEPHPFTPEQEAEQICQEALEIQIAGLATRLSHIRCKTAVIGISGGLDSTLALLATVLAFDRLGWSRDRIVGVTMPGYGTTSRTRNNASELMEALGITARKISITAACDQHFSDISHDPSVRDATYENAQARERTQILMDIANQTNGIVIGTGDLSELALGWATYNGDHMSMYGLNADIPKTMVREMVSHAADHSFKEVRHLLADIIDTPISPELLPASASDEIQQVTEDLVGPYELHDFFLYNILNFGFSPEKIFFLARKAFNGVYDDKTIKKWLKTFIRRFFSQQFKRSCMPDGPKVVSVSLSPRGDWQMPSDAHSDIFLDNLSR